jgi:hypothetical protein
MEYFERQAFKNIEDKLDVLIRMIKAVLQQLGVIIVEETVVRSITVTIGENVVNTVLTVGQKAQATAHGWSGLAGSGSELPLVGPVSWASADPTVATVDTNGEITGVGPSKLDANGAPIPVDITATDAATGLSNPTGDATVTDTPVVLTVQSVTVTVAQPQ